MKKLLIIGTVFPEPNSTAAGTRMMQIIELFCEQDYLIHFCSASSISEHSANLNSKKITCSQILLNDPSFDELLRQFDPSIVVFDRYISEEQFGWRVAEICPAAVRILDTEDLHFLRKAREDAYRKDKGAEGLFLINDIFKREVAAILRCDLTLIISEFEMSLLTEQFRIDSEILFYMPMFAENRTSRKTFDERTNFISIGNFLHAPNWFTVLKLNEIWPEIRKQLPDAELHIYGASSSPKVHQLHSEERGFIIKGRAHNVEQVFSESRVLLAPVPFGAGIKGKLLDSMQYGLPNVTSLCGAEAMHGNLPWNGYITSSDEEFLQRAVELYTSPKIWNESVRNGHEIVKRRFQKGDFDKSFFRKLKKIVDNLQRHRNQNFLGQILQHHTLQSTKYLSKWIEEKNRR